MLEGIYESRVALLHPSECEVLYGRAGYLSALLFAAKHTRHPPNLAIVKVDGYGDSLSCVVTLTSS